MQVNRMICQMKAENGLKRRGKFLETGFFAGNTLLPIKGGIS